LNNDDSSVRSVHATRCLINRLNNINERDGYFDNINGNLDVLAGGNITSVINNFNTSEKSKLKINDKNFLWKSFEVVGDNGTEGGLTFLIESNRISPIVCVVGL